MKRINKIIELCSAFASCSLLATPILTSCSNTPDEKEYHIVDFNDIHGAIAGYGETVVDVPETFPGCLRLAKAANEIITKHPGSIFVSAGDENSGEAWSVCDKGGTTYPVLKAMDVRYAAVGNHAFEWGLDDMASYRYDKLARTDNTVGNYFLAANILNTNLYHDKEWCVDQNDPQYAFDYDIWKNQRVKWADPYKILNMGDAKICLIGLTTKNTYIDGNKPITNQLSFADYNASIHYTKDLIKEELGKTTLNSIDSFILLTHIDSDYKNNELKGEAVQLASEVDSDIDAIISAHSHKTGCGKIWNNILNKPICVGQAGTAGQNLLDTKLIFNSRADNGKKLSKIDMSVKHIDIPKDATEAANEWNSLLETKDSYLSKVATAYKEQKVTVNKKVNEVIATNTLDPAVDGDTQPLTEGGKTYNFDGYLNTIAHQSKQIGHFYVKVDEILDHLGGWLNRANIIGFAMQNWEEILDGNLLVPSVSITSQDSAPKDLAGKDIKLRGMFDIQPHDNREHYGFMSVMQLANLINYALAGDPEFNKDHPGFDYDKKWPYQPDLTFYKAPTGSGTNVYSERVAYDLTDDAKQPLTKSSYACGPMSWYGIRAELTEIKANERSLTFKHPVTGVTTPLYDPTAKYRVNTKEETVTVSGKETKVILPQIWVYDGSTLNFGNIDKPTDENAWHPASWWYEKEHPDPESGEAVKLIPFIVADFTYNGGNKQFKMLKPYAEYSYFTKGFDFYGMDTNETERLLISIFCQYSIPDAHEWSEFTVPTNIPWRVIKSLKQYA